MAGEWMGKDKSPQHLKNVANIAIQDKKALNALLNEFFDKNIRISQWAATPVGYVAEKNCKLLFPYIEKMLDAAKSSYNSGIKRNVIRTLQFMDFPEEYEGIVYEYCYEQVSKPNEAIAVRAFALKVCVNIVLKHKDLKDELIQLLDLIQDEESPGVRSVMKFARKSLKL